MNLLKRALEKMGEMWLLDEEGIFPFGAVLNLIWDTRWSDRQAGHGGQLYLVKTLQSLGLG